MSKKILVSVSAILALLDASDAQQEVIDLVRDALGGDAPAQEDAPVAAAAAPVASVLDLDKVREFLRSDPRFTSRSVKAISDHFAVSESDVREFVNENGGSLSARTSRRGLGLLVSVA